MGVSHCPWWITGRDDYGFYRTKDNCALVADDCDPINKNVYVGSPLLCPKTNRIRYSIIRSRKGIKYLTEKDKDFLMYAYRKITQVNYSHYENDTFALVQSLQKRCAKIATERCRADKECPFKALLPEYDLIENPLRNLIEEE
jgi:hypothetical protein